MISISIHSVLLYQKMQSTTKWKSIRNCYNKFDYSIETVVFPEAVILSIRQDDKIWQALLDSAWLRRVCIYRCADILERGIISGFLSMYNDDKKWVFPKVEMKYFDVYFVDSIILTRKIENTSDNIH